jgi:tetratricopeptide (TPR) repeat protein
VRPRALSAEGAGRLLREALGVDVSAAAAEACHGATRGNPFLLGELAAAIKADGLTDGLDAERMRDLAPDTISRALLVRLARMPAAAGALAKAVAVLGNDAELRDAAGLAGVEADEATEALDALVAADILAAERPLNFVHPIVRGAVYADMGPGERASAHARAAQLLLAWDTSPERVASHLLHAEPAGDARVVESLRAAARTALGRGGADTAVRYLERARTETEAAAADGELMVELGIAESVVPDPEAAMAHLREGIPQAGDPQLRAAAWFTLSRTTMGYVGPLEAAQVLDQALEDLQRVDAETRRRLEVELTTLTITHASTFKDAAERIDRRPSVAGETDGERLMLCNSGYRAGMTGEDLDRTLDLCRMAFAGGRLAATEGTASNAFDQALYVMVFAGALDECREQVEIAVENARGGTSPWAIAGAWGMRAAVRCFQGDIAGCEADARQALSIPSFPPFAMFVYGVLAWALVERGDLDGAEAALDASGMTEGLPPVVHMEILLWARARLRLAQGRDREALKDLHEYGNRSERVGALNPGIPWRADAALAYARIGEMGRARELADDQLRRARTWSADWVVGAALRDHALVIGGEQGLTEHREAAQTLAASQASLEHAKALVELGAALRRAGRRRDAREPLRDGLELARHCGAPPLAERAHAEGHAIAVPLLLVDLQHREARRGTRQPALQPAQRLGLSELVGNGDHDRLRHHRLRKASPHCIYAHLR